MHKVQLLLILTLSLFSFLGSYGQEARGQFVSDTIEIGKPVPFSVVAIYPAESELYLPDSTYNFSPFIFSKKEWYPTQVRDSMLYDSVVYFLTTFELDTVQDLSIKLLMRTESDTMELNTTPDSVTLRYQVSEVPDSLSQVLLKEQTNYFRIAKEFNYPFWIAGILIFLLVSLLISILFGNQFINQWRIYQINKRHKRFQAEYQELINALSNEPNPKLAEKLVSFWKKYMRTLDQLPYPQMTSAEIIRITKEKDLSSALMELDKFIYSKQFDGAGLEAVHNLKEYANQRYQSKTKQIKDGK